MKFAPFLLLLCAPAALAAPITATTGTSLADATSDQSGEGLDRSQYWLGDMGGLRGWLAKGGLTFSLSETSEILGNVSGGIRQGAAYDGVTTASLSLDTAHAFGWHGGTMMLSALQIHGRNLSADNLATLQTASGIEAERATRLWEAWYQQKFLADDALDLKIGQQSLDNEFMVSPNGLNFINTMMGWPMLPSADMPSGGPAYPMASLGLRARYRLSPSLTVLGGGFTANPGGDRAADAQAANASGVMFPLPGRALVIGEIQYRYPALGGMVSADEAAPLPHVYKLGVWNTGGTTGIYGVADQMLWQSADEAEESLEAFTRVMGTPDDGQNPIRFSANAGLVLHDPLPHRDDDSFSVGFGYTAVAPNQIRTARAAAIAAQGLDPLRGDESFIEITYSASITQWMSLQPDFQYVVFPGGGAIDPARPSQRIANEAVLGLRTVIQF